jgi:hypothetical protein
VSGPTFWLPLTGFAPDQAPPAVHEVALLVDQLKVEEPFMFTVVGLALSVTVGSEAGSTVTVTERLALPPGPSHMRVNVLVVVRELRVWLPDVALVPDQAPDAVHEVALVEDQLRVEEPL